MYSRKEVQTITWKYTFDIFDICVTVRHWYSNINSQLDATIKNFIDNYDQLNMFRAIISPILMRIRLCLQLVV
jgi:hypothetical protein